MRSALRAVLRAAANARAGGPPGGVRRAHAHALARARPVVSAPRPAEGAHPGGRVLGRGGRGREPGAPDGGFPVQEGSTRCSALPSPSLQQPLE